MYLSNVRSKIARHNKNSLNIFAYFLTQDGKPISNYKQYLAEGAQPDPFHNSRNLFDDSNSADRHWLKIAKQHLSKAR